MIYSKKDIGIELKKELSKGYDIDKISTWADDLYLSLRGESYKELRNILSRIDLMRAGAEFEYTESELHLLSEMLINEEYEPIEKLHVLISKGLTGRS